MFKELFLLVIAYLVGRTAGNMLCYACSFSAVDTDRSCLTISNSTPRVQCSMTYCTIMRQEYRDPAGDISSFTRGCESNPDYLNHDVIDPNFVTYYRACTSSLCNIGDGIRAIGGSLLNPRPQYNGSNLLVPGT
ncbi:uncharacterized protein LOC123657422 [Melitaea cinxia]|uniref:uncharacterized protein LOC123657422 n=1 Tax=Melitaea cinxia TaxID=113334 RepID=UPI001E2748F6|nr:uncharacterized protein LOC123657422 [Melitaea cinxia]